MKNYSEEEILMSYQGRCISDKEELKEGYCGSAPIEIHREQLNDPDSWVHSIVPTQIERIKPKPTIEQLQAENERLKEALEHILEYWNRDENQMAMSDALWHFIETAEQALKDSK